MEPSSHKWRFFRAGGFDQPCIETGADLVALPSLDQKLWAVLSCPTVGLEFDAKTLQHIDTDGDGRVRAPELLAAVTWAVSMLKDADELTRGADALPLAAINDAVPEGKRLLTTARDILANRGRSGADTIDLEDIEEERELKEQAHPAGARSRKLQLLQDRSCTRDTGSGETVILFMHLPDTS